MKHKRLSRAKSKKLFRNGVNRQHPKNRLVGNHYLRGGVRL